MDQPQQEAQVYQGPVTVVAPQTESQKSLAFLVPGRRPAPKSNSLKSGPKKVAAATAKPTSFAAAAATDATTTTTTTKEQPQAPRKRYSDAFERAVERIERGGVAITIVAKAPVASTSTAAANTTHTRAPSPLTVTLSNTTREILEHLRGREQQ